MVVYMGRMHRAVSEPDAAVHGRIKSRFEESVEVASGPFENEAH